MGRICKFDILVGITAKGAMAGEARIGGLPFTAKNDSVRRTAVTLAQISNVDLDATRNILTGIIRANEDFIVLVNCGDNTSIAYTNVSQIQATSSLILSGEYEVE